MLVKIDMRETALYAACVENYSDVKDVTIVSEVLVLGDIIICSDDGTECVIVERKTLADLASSIRDGRYKEQGFRLNECSAHNHNIIYLVEGNLQCYNERRCRLERKALLSSFVSLTYFKGFSMHRTDTVRESAEWIMSYASKLQRENGVSFYDKNAEHKQESYVDVSSRVKKNNITVKNIAPIMLSQIPGVSAAVATAVMAQYGSLKELLEALTTNPAALDEITIATKTNKHRKISKTSCQNIYEYLVVGEKNEIVVDTE